MGLGLHRIPFRAMGSPCELQLYAESEAAARELAAAAVEEIARLEQRYSRYRDDSLTHEINASAGSGRPARVDDECAALLDYAATAHRESGGRFDITSGVLRRAWDFRSGRLPSQAEIDELLPLVGFQRLRWRRPHLTLPAAGMEIDFGGYVKEYAADRIAEWCRGRGVRHGLVELGGDIAVIGPHPDRRPWQVGVRHPRDPERAIAQVGLWSGGVASSGDYERFLVVDGRRYCHVLDPRTGWPVEGCAGVTVAAAHCLIAGTGATVAMLHGGRAGRWLRRLGLPYLIADEYGALSGPLTPGSGHAGVAPSAGLRA